MRNQHIADPLRPFIAYQAVHLQNISKPLVIQYYLPTSSQQLSIGYLRTEAPSPNWTRQLLDS